MLHPLMKLCLHCVHLWGIGYRVRGKFLSLTRTKATYEIVYTHSLYCDGGKCVSKL